LVRAQSSNKVIHHGSRDRGQHWTVGIMGAAVGYSYYDIGIILTVANLVVLMLRTIMGG
jgi:hypothetical protein